MAEAIPHVVSVPRARVAAAAVPYPVWGALLSTACMITGWNWDIQWHRAMGRDTIWTPPHIAIYVALAVAFAYNAALVWSHTFGRKRGEPGVRVMGFDGPSASFFTLWAILLQGTAIVFDQWFHNVYGLDINVFSPPHFLLSLGMAAFYFGQFMVVATWRNRLAAEARRVAAPMVILVWAFFLANQFLGMDPKWGAAAVRSVWFLGSCALMLPFALLLIQEYLESKWAGVWSSAAYMGSIILLMQIFQFFPAEPLFGPVYHRLDVFYPPLFPVVLVIPAAVLGVIYARRADRTGIWTWILLGLVFVVVFAATNFAVSEFLMSPLARNRFFAGHFPGSAFEAGFKPIVPLLPDARGLTVTLVSVALAAASCWAGALTGRWMRRVVR